MYVYINISFWKSYFKNKMSYNFSPYIRENLEFLQKLSKTSSEKKQKALLLTASADQILAIVEICANVLKYNFILTRRQKLKLAKFADFYRSISRARSERTARKRIQRGGNPALAVILVPVLSVLAEHLLKKITD